jgi:hypothetical protein
MAGQLVRINGQIKAWSWSRLRDWEFCGFFAGVKHVLGKKEPGNKAMQRGSEIGKQAEDYVLGTLPRLPPDLSNFADGFKKLRAFAKKNPDNIWVEDSWTFRADYTETHVKDWDGAWLRIKMDVATADISKKLIVVEPIDHKTGKYSPEWGLQDYLDQLELYAKGCLLKFGKLARETKRELVVRPKLWFLDHAVEEPAKKEYTLDDLEGLKKTWLKRVTPMLKDKAFKPRPNSRCTTCHFRASNGGPCKH